MIQSMTAFAREESHGTWGNLVWELRTVNHRYLDISLRLPEAFRSLEPILRERIAKVITRGKVEGMLNYQPITLADDQLDLNLPLIKQLISACDVINALAPQPAQLNALEILRWPGAYKGVQIDHEQIKALILTTIVKALEDTVKVRAKEGEALKNYLLLHLDKIEEEINKIKAYVPGVIGNMRAKILNQMHHLQINCDKERIEQEIIFWVQKSDINEELERLHTHVIETRTILINGGVVGRRLDFLMQELNRETNTVGSKSLDVYITSVVVELKVLIEQMREQIQNIE